MKKTQLARPKTNEESSLALARSYRNWILDLRKRYKATQCKAAVAVNSALIEFYWNLGKDIRERFTESAGYGANFFKCLSCDLAEEFNGARGFSVRNLKYCLDFYDLYGAPEILQQVVAKSNRRTGGRENLQQLVADLVVIPWGHHCVIIDKCKGDREKALFYVRRTIQNGWSRNSLLNWLSTDLYERAGKGQTNFALTMPSDDCDLAQQLVKDPQGITDYELKKVLPTQAQLAKCYADAEAQFAATAPKTKKRKEAK